LAVALIGIVGKLVTDNLADHFHASLILAIVGFSPALAATFAVRHASEKMLSIQRIFTAKREAFYWRAIASTFALGADGGDMIAEKFGLGCLPTGLLFGMIIASLACGYFLLGLDPILGLWLAYIFARPLGAPFGGLLSQPTQYGGFGLGTIITSALFLAAIIGIVACMSVTREGKNRAVAK
jgi:uncharacterized membrane-anchored protein